MPTTTTTITTFLLLFATLLTTTTSAPILGLDTFLTQQSRHDPQATNDSFLSLPSSLKHPLSLSSHTHTSSLLSSILSLSLSFSLNIKLIGPSFSSVSPNLLSSFLFNTHLSDHFHVILPFLHQHHNLAFKHSPHIDVSLSSPSLSSQLSQTLKSEIEKTPSSLRSSLLSIPHTIIDQIIKQDFEKEKPVDYGPAFSSDGVLPKGEFHPLATIHGQPKSDKALLADLASLVYSAYQVLLVPSLRIPVPFANSLIVQFIHVYGSDRMDLIGGFVDEF